MTYPFKSMHDYNNFINRADLNSRAVLLKQQAQRAMAWGVPDRESIGYTHSELTTIISKLLNLVEMYQKREIENGTGNI
jgi:hypothetical protein